MKLVSLLFSFLFAVLTVSAQVNPQCPTISVEGLAGIPLPGEPYVYKAIVKPTESTLTYNWTVSRGTITEGQGTATIKVRLGPDDPDLTVTIEIGGLPQECGKVASETISDLVGNIPKAKKLDTFSLPLNSISEQRFQKIADAITNNPTSQTYILIPADKSVGDAIYARLNKLGLGDLDPPRITYVEMYGDRKIVEVWLVPPGASPPSECEICKRLESTKQVCPTISVIGPPGLTNPGEIMKFGAEISGARQAALMFKWKTTAGIIEAGQGTDKISVRVPNDFYSGNITATVEITGLSEQCPSSASETAGVPANLDYDPPDSYGALSLNDEKARLQNAAYMTQQSPEMKLFIVKYSPTHGPTEKKRQSQLTFFLVSGIKFAKNRFAFVYKAAKVTETIIVIARPGFKFDGMVLR